jgi:hypothetical protein
MPLSTSLPTPTRRSWRLAGVFALLLGLVMLALPVAADQTYTEPNGTYALTLPDGWSAQQPSDASYVAQWGTNDTSAIGLLAWQALAPGTSSLDFYNAGKPGLASLPGFQARGTRTIAANGGVEPLIEFTFTNGGQRLRAQRVYIVSGTNGWTLTFLTLDSLADRYLPDFATMAQSFTLMPAGNPAPTTTAEGPPLVHYSCIMDYAGFLAGGFALNVDGAYLLDDGTGGAYTFDSAASRITFTSGPYADTFYGDYQLLTSAISSTPTIYIRSLDGSGGALSCQPGY